MPRYILATYCPNFEWQKLAEKYYNCICKKEIGHIFTYPDKSFLSCGGAEENIKITQEDPEQIIGNVIVKGIKQQLQVFVHEYIIFNVIIAVDVQNFGLVIHWLLHLSPWLPIRRSCSQSCRWWMARVDWSATWCHCTKIWRFPLHYLLCT